MADLKRDDVMKFRNLALVTLLTASGCASYAEEPMTVKEVAAAAKAGITFVENAHISARQAANPDLLHQITGALA